MSPNPQSEASVKQDLTWYLYRAVLIWGSVLALGTWFFDKYWHEGAWDRGPLKAALMGPLKAAIVLGCVLGFLGLWSLTLRIAKRRNPLDSGS